MVYQTRKILVYNSKNMAMGNLIKVDIMPSNDKNMEKTYCHNYYKGMFTITVLTFSWDLLR